MLLALAVLGVISLVELLLYTTPLWRTRKVTAPFLTGVLAVSSLALLVVNPAAWTVLVAFAGIYRCVNLARVAIGRIQGDYLFNVSRRTGLWLIGWQLLVVAVAVFGRRYDFDSSMLWQLAADAQLICAAGLFVATSRHLRTSTPPKLTSTFTDAELPALTVAIPARNETTDLEECLRSLLSSTYPKLEIVVLDDCSQDKRTPEIIRGFAHAGVRFIDGKQPPDSWLAKNYAYAQLTEAANGDLLLFCGVDVRFQPGSLDALVKTLLQKQKSMLSILPRNESPHGRNLPSWFMQPNRYAWELALPRRFMERPPVLSTCWLVTRERLEAVGGFDAVRRKGVPESYLARAVAVSDDGYSFLRSDDNIGITSHKASSEQRATATRTRYLQLHRRPEITALVGLSEFGVLVFPLILAIASSMAGQWATTVLAGAAFVLDCIVYSKVFSLTYRHFFAKGLWLLPVAAAYDIGLLNYSMWRYEFREVLWKGRNVCIPLMQIASKLPAIEDSVRIR